jgi:hypothetical protein
VQIKPQYASISFMDRWLAAIGCNGTAEGRCFRDPLEPNG